MGFVLMFGNGCKKDDNSNNNTNANLPVLSTNAVTNITNTTATCGGNITSDGGSTVTERGVCWSTNISPTISNSKTSDGTGAGSFTSAITGISIGNIYYVRAYATNSNGTGYGSTMSFSIGNNTAPVITLTGSGSVIQDLHTTYTDQGATAIDNIEGNITSRIVVTGLPVNTDLCGETILHYNVSNLAGIGAVEVTRSVKIKSDLLRGAYSVDETKKMGYNVSVTQSSIVYNKVLINNFGGYGTNITIDAIVDGATITVPAQMITQGGDVFTIQGTGTYNGSLYKILTVEYTETLQGMPPTAYTATYTKM